MSVFIFCFLSCFLAKEFAIDFENNEKFQEFLQTQKHELYYQGPVLGNVHLFRYDTKKRESSIDLLVEELSESGIGVVFVTTTHF